MKEGKKEKEKFEENTRIFKEKNNQQCLKGEDDDQYDQEYSRVLMEGCLETNNTEAANREQKRICFVVANFIASVILTKNRPHLTQCVKITQNISKMRLF